MWSLKLGNSETTVPPVSIGAMYWGTTVPVDDAHTMLDYAVDHGACFIDTANNYPFWTTGGQGGESETCLGEWLSSRGPRARERVVLATKVGARPASPGADFSNILGLGSAAIFDQVHGSLERLRTDHVDVLYAHIDDRTVPLSETVGALQETVDQGLTRTVACSNITADRLREALQVADGGPRYVAVQNRFTLLSPEPDADLAPQVLLTGDVQDVCSEEGVAMVAYSTLLEGAYTRADREIPAHYRRPGADSVLDTLRRVAGDAGLDAGQAVLAWLTHRTRPIIPVVGASRVEQIESAVTAVTNDFPAESVDLLEQARSQLQ